MPSTVRGGGGNVPGSALSPSASSLAYAVSHGVTLHLLSWAADRLQLWLPFGPPLMESWPSPVRQTVTSSELVSDDQFVWGPNVGRFDIGGFLQGRGSTLAAYADDIALWADYSSVSPKVLLTVLELRYDLVSSANLPEPATVRADIQNTAIDLATAFYDHLYTWGSRRPQGVAGPSLPPVLTLADGTTVQISAKESSGTYAVSQALGMASGLDRWQELVSQGPGGFPAVFGGMFPGTDALATDNPINPTALPPDNLFQLPFPLGATWTFSGPHSWNGGSSPPPFSSMDFFSGSSTCSAPPNLYAAASAAGGSYRPSGYSCWLEIDNGGGWTTSYYHLLNLTSGGPMQRNGRIGSIACETCAGGFATGPHVHWSLKYNGAYVSLEGVKVSGWTIHVGTTAYDSGSLERGGILLAPYSLVTNDYHLYFATPNTSLRFHGNNAGDVDRVKIQVDETANTNPGPAIDIGWQDFTVEWWMKALPGENSAGAVSCGASTSWRYGNVLFDRDRFNQDRDFGIALAGGRIVLGISGQGTGDLTLCGTTRVDDGQWHHIAVERNRWDGVNPDGNLWLFVDGHLEATAAGPRGDISYPDDAVPPSLCGPQGNQSCADDPYLVIGGEKYAPGDGLNHSFSGWIDELRVSNILRYLVDFQRPTANFTSDANTTMLLHLNDSPGTDAYDTSGFGTGPSNGMLKVGGSPVGPQWSSDVPFPGPTPTPTATVTGSPQPSTSPTATLTATVSGQPSGTPTPTVTPTPQPSPTPTLTATGSPQPTSTMAPSATGAAASSATPTATATSSAQLTPTGTATSTPLATGIQTPTPTDTPTPVAETPPPETSVPTDKPTDTPGVPPSTTPTPLASATPTQIFADVPPSYWAYREINALYLAGYVAGCSASPRLYCPERVLNRAESAVFILRGAYGSIADPPYPTPSSPTFADVARSFWGFGWIESLWKDGYTAGCGTNPLIYCPLRNHTRAEGSVFFLRIKNGVAYTPPVPTNLFTDVSPTAWYAPWVEAAYNEGLLPACNASPLRFCPDGPLNRAWAAYMMIKAKAIPLP